MPLTKEEVCRLLDEKGIRYSSMEHEAVYTMDAMEAAGILSRGTVCKNLFLRDARGKNHYLVTVPGHRRTDLKALAARIGSTKLSFASEERLMKYLGLHQGSVSPLGILNDQDRAVTVVFDEALRGVPDIGIHPNDNTMTLWMAFSDLEQLIRDHGNPVLIIPFE